MARKRAVIIDAGLKAFLDASYAEAQTARRAASSS